MGAAETRAFLEWLSSLAPWQALFLLGLILTFLAALGANGAIRGVHFDARHRAIVFGPAFILGGLFLLVSLPELAGAARMGGTDGPTATPIAAAPTATPVVAAPTATPIPAAPTATPVVATPTAFVAAPTPTAIPAAPTATPRPDVAAPAPTETPRPSAPAEMSVNVYFSHRTRSGSDFSAVFPVQRTVSGARPATGALEQLIRGPTSDEQREGYSSELAAMLNGPSMCGGPDFQLGIENGIATVRFCRRFSSAGVGQDARARSQLEATLKQFPTVQRVRPLTSDGHCVFDASGLDLCLR